MYNDSEIDKKYEVDSKSIKIFNKENYGNILQCINPTGIIKKFYFQAVVFGFKPNKFEKFNVCINKIWPHILIHVIYNNLVSYFQATIPIKIADEEENIKIAANCIIIPPPKTASLYLCPNSDDFTTEEINAYFNISGIVETINENHGQIRKNIIIKNTHSKDTLSYKWQMWLFTLIYLYIFLNVWII